MTDKAHSQKTKLALITSVVDNREGRGTALVARELLRRLLLRTDLFEFTLIHHEPSNDPIYTEHKTLLIPHLPSFLDRQIIRETYFWITLWARGTRFDIAHYLTPRIWPSYLLTPAKRIVFTAHEAGVMLNLHNPSLGDYLFRLTNRFLHQRMDVVIACSEFGRREIAAKYHLSLDRVTAIPLGVDSRFSPVELDVSAEETLARLGFKRPYLLSVGRLDPHKNIHRLVEAFGEVHPDFPEVQLALVGGKHLEDYTKLVLDTVDNYDIASSVHFAPFIPEADLPLIYSAASALIYPSVHEGFGLPILEAMSCGTPVATGTLTASPETAGGASILFNPLEVPEIEAALRVLLTDPEMVSSLKEKGFLHSKKYTWDKMTDRVISIYTDLASSS